MTWAEILQLSAGGLNDTARDKFTDLVLLPYLNMARIELEEIFELNSIPVTEETSAVLTIPANTSAIGFSSSPPLPSDLIEIKNLYESTTTLNNFIEIARKSSITPYISAGSTYTSFSVWAWNGQEIQVRAAANAVDIKIDYVKALFANMVTIPIINQQNEIKNTDGFLHFRTAGLAAEFIDENTTRSASLNTFATGSLERSLGISVKGMQILATRRRPFRAAFKRLRSVS